MDYCLNSIRSTILEGDVVHHYRFCILSHGRGGTSIPYCIVFIQNAKLPLRLILIKGAVTLVLLPGIMILILAWFKQKIYSWNGVNVVSVKFSLVP